jgi:hypothetical protein
LSPLFLYPRIRLCGVGASSSAIGRPSGQDCRRATVATVNTPPLRPTSQHPRPFKTRECKRSCWVSPSLPSPQRPTRRPPPCPPDQDGMAGRKDLSGEGEGSLATLTHPEVYCRACDSAAIPPNYSSDYEIARSRLLWPLPAPTTGQLSLTSTINPSRRHFVPQIVPRRSPSARAPPRPS